MKIIIGIIASHDNIYTQFKNVWLKAITKFKQTRFHKIIDFYFLYSEENKNSQLIQFTDTKEMLYVNFYDNQVYNSTTKSILMRTITFFNYIIYSYNLTNINEYEKYKNDGLFFLRTNLSTMFDFMKLIQWFENKPKTHFFGGSINGFYDNIYTTFSGTNLVFSTDIMLYLCHSKDKIDIISYYEDQAISQRIINDISVYLINIKRIDFIEMAEYKVTSINHVWPPTPKSVVYHKTTIGDNDVFCFRFKTFNRQNDINIMNLLVDKMFENNFNLTVFIDDYCNSFQPPLSKSEEMPEYDTLYSKNTFQITT